MRQQRRRVVASPYRHASKQLRGGKPLTVAGGGCPAPTTRAFPAVR